MKQWADLQRRALLTAIHEGTMFARVTMKITVQRHLHTQTLSWSAPAARSSVLMKHQQGIYMHSLRITLHCYCVAVDA